MLYSIANRFIINPSTFRLLSLQIDNIFCRRMSVQVDVSEDNANTTAKSQKRQTAENNDEVPDKIQKVEEETKEALQKLKRKNYVLMLGYTGSNYFGMQRNPGMKTIEEDLISALLKCDFITKDQYEDIREIKFQRAARTDKGVSAVRQIVSLKLPSNVNKKAINEHLPNEIRVFGIKRVTKGFNSKNQCDARTYRYVIPTFAFAEEDPNFLCAKEDEEIDKEVRLKQLSVINGKPCNEFRLTPEMLNNLNETLKLFEGTHNFHNFTSKVRPLDPRARRYIIYFRCIETYIANNIEFAVLEIKGQSFMLHQIRKMVALVVGICRNILTKDIITYGLSLERLHVPIAPGLGLSLHHVHYKYYNERYGTDGIHEALDWSEHNEEIEQFYKEEILKKIADTEVSEQITLNWLSTFYSPERFACKEQPAQCEEIS